MEPPAPTIHLRPPAGGVQRLVLAVSAAGAIVTLCWAALQVRAAKDEARQAREQAGGVAAVKTIPPSPPAPATPELSGKMADLERRLTEEQTRAQQAEKSAAARIKDLEGIVSFLRQENEAAQKTIERLSSLEHSGTGPEEPPVRVTTPAKSRDR